MGSSCFFRRMYKIYKPHVLRHMKFYENLFHDTVFSTKKQEISMFGINLTFLDVFEIIHRHEYQFQWQCHIVVTGSSSKTYFSHDVEIYHFRRSRVPFMRLSYRAADSVCSSELFVMSLEDELYFDIIYC